MANWHKSSFTHFAYKIKGVIRELEAENIQGNDYQDNSINVPLEQKDIDFKTCRSQSDQNQFCNIQKFGKFRSKNGQCNNLNHRYTNCGPKRN